jgi:hypothetical protein
MGLKSVWQSKLQVNANIVINITMFTTVDANKFKNG